MTLARKLGLDRVTRICLLGAPAAERDLILASCGEGVDVRTALARGRYDLIFFWPREAAGLAETFRRLQSRIRPYGAIWAVIPKKAFAGSRRVTLDWASLQAAGLETDLVDNKTATLSEQAYATRFVIRKERRAGGG